MSEEITVEEKAKAQGWVPKDEFRGDESQWRSAEEFVEVGEKIAPIQKERNNSLVKEVSELKKTMLEFRDDHVKAITAAKQESYDRAVADLRKQQREAVEEADVDKFEAVQKKIDKIEPPADIPSPKPEKEVSPEFVRWKAENAWYGEDVERTQYADFIGGKLSGEYPESGRGRKEFLKAVKTQVDKVFGAESVNSPAQNVESPSSPSGPQKNGKQTYNNLPAEAKDICDRFVKEGLFKDKEEYAKSYYKGMK